MKLCEELLAEFELSNRGAVELVRKTLRLARILDDMDALKWLQYELRGYTGQGNLSSDAYAAAVRSNREIVNDAGQTVIEANSIAQLEATLQSGKITLQKFGRKLWRRVRN